MSPLRVRVLTVADLHQSRRRYLELRTAVSRHEPGVLALVGDFLDLGGRISDRLSIVECAEFLANLPVAHLIFTRGNHEGNNWRDLVRVWPFKKRPLIALSGTAFTVGPLTIVGFPCRMGTQKPWADSMPKEGNQLILDPARTGRRVLSILVQSWLSPLIRRLRPAGRTLWLLHEPPISHPICKPQLSNAAWRKAVDRHQPLLTISGHDHDTPILNGAWWGKYDSTVCVNLGQGATELAYAVIDATFNRRECGLPDHLSVHAHPWGQSQEIQRFVPAKRLHGRTQNSPNPS